ncbi:hypothetical protein ABB37_05403 [Leptomonas pyrrhocoris]|uniref:Uncharacterized protein n=1 Tax=Leptomonas pyrrhocoris TaxID=157538 RepID=A0A0N1J4R8_LEPPY|nr:hypothetical protein ABB37_05403 [Leptomonas pyrrhocoris]KPA79602.1 hypothetical protein ABB37_05403 [Leptomonas pyrrhocoris]|eukprot:XP_015658041.1 hypothetical protein ABB37_05403 [Leptomonas pyrrhocoris]
MASPSAELFSIVRCALWKSGRDEARELFSLSSSAAQDGAAGAERRFNPDETHVYTLDSMDALDVTIDAQTHSAAWHHHLSQQHHCTPATKETVEGMLKVQFLLTSTVSSMTNTQKTPAQLLPLRIPLIKPNIECRPGVIWFRPGQQRHDGRAQVAYTQTFTVYNTSAAAARFRIYPVPGSTADIRKKAAMDTFRAQQQLQLQRSVLAASVAASPAVASELVTANTMTTTVGVVGDDVHHSLMHKVKEVVKMPATAPPAEGRADLVYVDDPAQFTISPSEGVVPAASLGGEPAEVKIRVDFREFSSIRYESLFAVAIEGDPSVPPTYVVVRGDSRDTEV